MNDLIRESVIELEDNKKYIIIDNYKVNNNDYILLTDAEDESENNNDYDNIYILRLDNNSNNEQVLSSISEDEMLDVQNHIYSLFEKANIFKNGKICFENLYKMSEDPNFLDNAKLQQKLENSNKEISNLAKKSEILDKAKNLMIEYNNSIKIYKNENDELKKINEGLKENNKYLQESLDKLPNFIRKLFIKETKLLK